MDIEEFKRIEFTCNQSVVVEKVLIGLPFGYVDAFSDFNQDSKDRGGDYMSD